MLPNLHSGSGMVTFTVRVQPNATREGIVCQHGDSIKIAVAAPAVDGRANDALIRCLAGLLQVPRLSVEIASGHTSGTKVMRVSGLTAEQVAARLMPIEAV